jgi:hypothetical protein
MPTSPVFPSIPVPTADPAALLESVNALKQTVEMLTGQDQSDKFAPHVFVQDATPDAYHVGDLWFCTSVVTSSFNVWSGAKWVKIAAVTAVTSMDGSVDTEFLLKQFVRPT